MTRNVRRYCLYLFVVLTSAGQAQIVLTGTVRTSDTQPLTGASILLKGTLIGTTTDIDGAFNLKVDDNQKKSTLVFSFIGFVSQELTIGEQTVFNIVLEEDATQLTEVVITGYTVQE